MNKKELIDAITQTADCPTKKAELALNSIMKAIAESLSKGEKVTLIGFGTFSANKRAARQGRNPQTGKVIDIPEKVVVKFKAGKALEETVNG